MDGGEREKGGCVKPRKKARRKEEQQKVQGGGLVQKSTLKNNRKPRKDKKGRIQLKNENLNAGAKVGGVLRGRLLLVGSERA